MPKQLETTIEWHNEARRLRDEGKTIAEIARTVGKDRATVEWALDKDGARKKRNERLRARREKQRLEREREAARPARAPVRDQRRRVDNLAIARLFAAGEIDRAELSRRLRGEELSA